MPVLQRAGVSSSVSQAAVWIVTDDADYDDLGILRKRFAFDRFRAIRHYESAKAMKICDDAGIDITRKAIWQDRDEILEGLEDEDLRRWLREVR